MRIEIGILDVNKITEEQWEIIDVEDKKEFYQLVNEHKDTIWYPIEEFVIEYNKMMIQSNDTLISWRIKSD